MGPGGVFPFLSFPFHIQWCPTASFLSTLTVVVSRGQKARLRPPRGSLLGGLSLFFPAVPTPWSDSNWLWECQEGM